MVSVCVQTYRHASFIAECLDSILAQKTNFAFEIIIGEDESNDGTREICERYAISHPQKIRLFLRSRKDVIYIGGKATGRYNLIENFKAAKGKYIAMCEGDDYWSEVLKLQKQYDFMEANDAYGICLHESLQLNTYDESKNRIIPDVTGDTVYTISDYILANKTATCSIFFRRNAMVPVPDWYYFVPFGDLGMILQVMYATNSKAYVIDKVMGVYRIHPAGIHGSMHQSKKTLANAYKLHITFTRIIKKHLLKHNEYNKVIAVKLMETYKQIYVLSDFENDSMQKFIAGIKYLYYRLLIKLSWQ